MTHLLPKILAATTLALACASPWAHGADSHARHRAFDPAQVEDTPFGREGDPAKVQRVVHIAMGDGMRYTPGAVVVHRGETVRFVIRNEGTLLHEMVLGTPAELQEHAALMKKFPEMEHADPNMAHVKPGATGEIVWHFTQPGRFQFACLQPGHFEAGMVGTVTVK